MTTNVQSTATVLPDDDDTTTTTLLSDEEFAQIEEVRPDTTTPEPAKPAPAAQEPRQQPAEEEELPQPLRGKTKAEIARMYAEAQQVIGRQGHELGTLRTYTDNFIKGEMAKRTAPPAPKPAKEPEDVDFFSDPKKAVQEAVARHPELNRLKQENQVLAQAALQTQRERAQAEFTRRHPDAGTILADPNFATWVMQSPVRTSLMRRADQQWDVESASELFGTWKELNAARAEQTKAVAAKAEADTKVAARAAAVPSGGNARPAPENTGSKKVYRRADIIRLMQTDRDRYEAMADEIQAAYAEGRVR